MRLKSPVSRWEDNDKSHTIFFLSSPLWSVFLLYYPHLYYICSLYKIRTHSNPARDVVDLLVQFLRLGKETCYFRRGKCGSRSMISFPSTTCSFSLNQRRRSPSIKSSLYIIIRREKYEAISEAVYLCPVCWSYGRLR